MELEGELEKIRSYFPHLGDMVRDIIDFNNP